MPEYGSFYYDQGLYGGSWFIRVQDTINTYKGWRFNFIFGNQGTTILDREILGADATVYLRYLIDGLILGFDSDSGSRYIHILSPMFDNLQASNLSYFKIRQSDSASDELYLAGSDFVIGTLLQWNWGFVPFDTTKLFVLGSAGNWTGEDGTNEVWTALGYTVYSSSNPVTTTITGLPEGGYRAYFLLAGDQGTETAQISCTGAMKNGSKNTGVIPSAGQYEYFDFIADANDSITFEFRRLALGVNINCGELILVPMSNGKNFPLDVVHQAFNLQTVLESV